MDLYVIAGPNGVGKTTFAREFLPNYADCQNFVNAGLNRASDGTFFSRDCRGTSGEMMLSEIRCRCQEAGVICFRDNAVWPGYMALLRQLKAKGTRSTFFFLWVTSVDLALSRVQERVSRGGHDVPEAVVRRRFDRSKEISCLIISDWRIGGCCLTTRR